MAAGPIKLGRTYIKQQAAWGTKQTSFADADSVDVQGTFTPALTEEALGQPVQRPRFGASPKQAGSRAGGTVTMTWVMTNHTPGTAQIEHKLIADALGVLQAQAGIGTIANTSIDTRLDVTTANADWIGQGALIGLTGGGKQIVWVKDVDTTTTPDEVDITTALATPDDAVSVGAAITIALSEDNLANLPFTLQFQTNNTNAGFRLWDGRVSSLTITANAKQQVQCQATLTFLDAEPVDALTAPAFTFPRTQLGPNINAVSMNLDDDAEFCYASAVITITNALVEAPCNGSDQGVSQLITSDRTVTITERVVATDLYTEAFQSPGVFGARTWGMTSRGAASGAQAACYGAGMQLAAVSNPTDLGGIWGIERQWEVTNDNRVGDGTAGASTVKNTNFRISFG